MGLRVSRSNLTWLIGLCLLARAIPAQAVPAFAMQTGQPCAACHVGAFGPQLKPYGRDFKMNGYVASASSKFRLPIAISGWMSLTHTDKAQPSAAAPHFASNNNLALDQVSVYYAGRITQDVGAFIQVTYDGIADQAQADNADIRYANGDGELFDQDMVWGIDANNNPTVSDVWNSVPAWGFPYNGSALVPEPAASAVVDGALGQRVAGLGAYIDWNDLVYLETDLYRGLGYDVLNATGEVPVTGADRVEGVVPYGRVALEQQVGRSYFELGGYGLHASIDPGGGFADDRLDHYTDLAADANYQFILNPRSVTSDMLSAHATYIHESGQLDASSDLLGIDPNIQRCLHMDADGPVFPGARQYRQHGVGYAEWQPQQRRLYRRIGLRTLGQAGLAVFLGQSAAGGPVRRLFAVQRYQRARVRQQRCLFQRVGGGIFLIRTRLFRSPRHSQIQGTKR